MAWRRKRRICCSVLFHPAIPPTPANSRGAGPGPGGGQARGRTGGRQHRPFPASPGEGAQFFFTLPISGAMPGAASQHSEGEGLQVPPAGPVAADLPAPPRWPTPTARLLEPFGNRVVQTGSMAEAVGTRRQGTFSTPSSPAPAIADMLGRCAGDESAADRDAAARRPRARRRHRHSVCAGRWKPISSIAP